jgi:hypothetical protein
MFPIETFRETLLKVVKLFEQYSIRFHVTGGLTSVVYGDPRMTQDIDIVIDNEALASQLESFLSALDQTDFLFDRQVVRQAVEQKSMFQLFDNVESLKLDIYPRELIAGELARSQISEVFGGVSLPVVSLADATVSKLVWISKGSHKSRRDVKQLFRRASAAERSLIHELTREMNLEALLAEVLAEPDEISS